MKININEITVEKLNINDLDYYIDFEKQVKDNMNHSEWLGNFDKMVYEDLLNNGSMIYIWIYKDELIASGMLIPARQKDLDKFFSSDLDYKEVIDFGPEMVNPKYIGNGLQNIVINYLEKISKELNYKYAITTIHPENIYSINNFLKNNFKELGMVALKRGNRNVYRKRLIEN